MPEPPRTATTPRSSDVWGYFVSGGLAGAIAKTCVAPLERLKILNQAGSSFGILAPIRTVWRNEGILGFWAGNFAACVRIVPVSSCTSLL